jgi:hypothetical protein
MLIARRSIALFAASCAAIAVVSAAEPESSAPPPADSKASEPPAQPQNGETDLERRLRIRGANPRHMPEQAPQAAESQGEPVELPPELRAGVIADAATRGGVEPSEVTVKSAEAVTWPDGSLGCPQPGVVYTQMIVPGYRVVLLANGKEYDYRAGQKGSFQLCVPRAGMLPAPLPGRSTR